MIKIEFSGLSFQNSDFKDETFSEGFLIPDEDDVIPISSEWNSEIYDVQFMVYNIYSFTLYLRDSKYQSFQKIQYASKVNFFEEIGNPISAKIIDFNAEKYLNEFWKIDLKIKDLNSKLIENIILAERYGLIKLRSAGWVSFQTYLNLPVLDNIEFSQSIIDEFKDRITDYNKTSELKMARFYLLKLQLLDFYNILEDINLFSDKYIEIGTDKYRQYIVKKEDIGNDLFEITLTLYKENRITV